MLVTILYPEEDNPELLFNTYPGKHFLCCPSVLGRATIQAVSGTKFDLALIYSVGIAEQDVRLQYLPCI